MKTSIGMLLLIVGLAVGGVGGYVMNSGQIGPLQSQVSSLQSDNAALQSQVSSLQTQITALQSDKRALQENVSAVQAKLSDAESQMAALNKKLEEFLVPIVTVISYPPTVSMGEHFVVTWNVTGGTPGKITHTAVHYGNQTGDPGRPFYGFPQISQVFTGDTPQTFRTDIAASSTPGTIHFRAHAIIDGRQVWSDDMTASVTQSQTFILILSVESFSIHKGEHRTVTVTTTSVGGFNSPVALTFVDVPSGVTATLNPNTVTPTPGGQVNSSLDLSVGTDTSTGTYTFRVIGTYGSIIQSDALTVTITEAVQPVTIEIRSFAFNPSTVTVRVGTTITFINYDSVLHTATGTGWNSGDLLQGQSWSHAFTAAGSYDYYCIYHPYMTGTITVTP